MCGGGWVSKQRPDGLLLAPALADFVPSSTVGSSARLDHVVQVKMTGPCELGENLQRPLQVASRARRTDIDAHAVWRCLAPDREGLSRENADTVLVTHAGEGIATPWLRQAQPGMGGRIVGLH